MAVLARSVSGQVPVGELVFIRMAVGLVAVSAYYAVSGRRPHLAHPYLLASRGLFGSVAVTLYFLSIEHMPVGPATLLNNTSPGFAAVLAALLLRERLSLKMGAGLAVALVGAAVVVLGTAPPGQPLQFGLGAIAGLLGAALSAGALVSIRALRSDTDSVTVLFSFFLIGSLVTLPLAGVDLQALSPPLWISSVGVGLLSLAGQLFLTYGLAYVPTASGTATTLLTTVFSWGMGFVLLHEPINALSGLGALLCVGGIVIASRSAPA